MRSFLLLLLLFILSASSVGVVSARAETLTAEEEALLKKDLFGAVRGFIWGVPPTLVLENEEGTFLEEKDGALFYMDYIRGIKCTIGYEFADNKLFRARIFLEKHYPDPQDRVRDLLLIREDLSKRYGEPTREEFKWLNDEEKGWPDNWGWAVYRGDLFINIGWQTAESYVEARTGASEKYNPQTSIIYESLEYRQKEADQKNSGKLLETP